MGKGFEELPVFVRAYRVSLEIHRATKSFPKDEIFSITDQIRRSTKSVCANLAEGYASQISSKKEFKRFVMMALRSSDEVRVWLRYCLDLEYINKTIWQKWRDEYQEISKMLHGLHKSIK